MKNKLLVLLPLVVIMASCSIAGPVLSSSSEEVMSSSGLPVSSLSSDSSLTESSSSSSSGKSSSNSSNSSSSSSKSSSSSSATTSSEAISSSSSEASSSAPAPDFVYNNPEFEHFFDPSTKIDIVMDFDTESITNMSLMGGTNITVYHDVYHPCTLTLSIDDVPTVYENVGVRLKGGDFSRSDFYYNGYGYAHFKLNFSTIFDDGIYDPLTDETIKDRRILNDVKKLDLKWNRNQDETFTKENYAHYMLNEEGILAQRINNCKVTIKENGVPLSWYTNIDYHVNETVDKQFLQRRMPKDEAKGNLYKGGYVGDDAPNLNDSSDYLMGVEDNYEEIHYTYSLKTNESKNNHTLLQNCIDVLSADDETLSYQVKERFSEVMDVDYFIKYCALMWVVGNPDDFRYNSNNTYFYFNSVTNKMYIIPQDNDRCLGINIHGAMNLSVKGPMDVAAGYNGSSNSRPRVLRRFCLSNFDENRPLIPQWNTRYLQLCNQYANKYLDSAKFNAYTNSFAYKSSGGSYENVSFAEYAYNKLGTLS